MGKRGVVWKKGKEQINRSMIPYHDVLRIFLLSIFVSNVSNFLAIVTYSSQNTYGILDRGLVDLDWLKSSC